MVLDRLIVIDDVTGLADWSEAFAYLHSQNI